MSLSSSCVRRVHPLALMIFAMASSARAQEAPVSPVTITPNTLAPDQRDKGFRVEIPETGALKPPAGAESMAVTLGTVSVEGVFPEVADQVAAVTKRIEGERVSLAQIYAMVSEIEAIHARAGYVLARISVPPQNLADNAPMRLVMTDGFIETVDVSALPKRIQGPILARAGKLVGQHHVTMREIENKLMLTSDLPGLTLRSTLMRGNEPGGTKLVLEGNHQLVSGSLAVGRMFDPSLGDWGVMAGIAINSAFGLGEQIYGLASSEYRLDNLFNDNSRARVTGAGAVLPLADGRFTINPEVTYARTAPDAASGAVDTVGTLRRLTVRGYASLLRMRDEQTGLNLAVEQIEETNKALGFDTDISRDRYLAARFGADWSRQTTSGERYALHVKLSQGLGDLAAISAAKAEARGVPYSRTGAANDFTKLSVEMGASWKPSPHSVIALSARGQSSFDHALFRAEQFSLEGSDGLSAYVGGYTAVDSGVVARGEAILAVRTGSDEGVLPFVMPYVFGALGAGWIEQPTAVEKHAISAFNLGGGLRASVAERLSLSIEYAHGISDTARLNQVDRVNVNATLRF